MSNGESRFYFRINKIQIKDNREKRSFFKRDRAEVRLYSFITTDNTDLPELGELNLGLGDEEKRSIIKATVERSISSRRFIEIDNVKDNQILTFGDTGYTVYQSDVIPKDFNWIFLGIESDTKDRDFGKILEETVKSDDFSTFNKDLLTLLGKAASSNPAYAAGMAVAKFATGIFAEMLKRNKDDLLGALYMSLNREEHYRHLKRDVQDAPDLTQNMFFDYTIFGYENQ
jgi:hypothetical protein